MKKLFTLLGIMLCLAGLVSAQDCGFKVKFEVIPASCYNNGKVAYALLDANGDPISDANAYGLEDIRIYFKVNAHDSASYGNYYAGGWDTLVIDYGNYIIGVEAACRKSDGNYTKLDTHRLMNIPTTYVTPSFESFYNIAADSSAYGNRPSLDCISTGRVQLLIKDGKYPYYVTIMDYATGETLRVDTFLNRQYSGTNQNLYRYKDYYSIDNLPPGNWVFAFVDGCEYGHPYHTHEVGTVAHPKLTSIYDKSHSGTYIDSVSKRYVNVTVNIDNPANYFSNYTYNRRYWYNLAYLPQIAEYRIDYGGTIGTSEWKPVPSTGYNQYGNNYCRITLRDTVNALYCEDILDRPLYIEWRDNCIDTIIRKPFSFPKSLTYSSASTYYTDSTKIDTCVQRYHRHIRSHYVYNNSSSNLNGNFAKPLVWYYIDTNTGDTIKRDTVTSVTANSYLYDTDIIPIYGSFEQTPCTLNIKRVLSSDECGELYSRTDNLIFYTYTNTYRGSTYVYAPTYSVGTCADGSASGTVNLSFYTNYTQTLDGTIIRLVGSPNSNFYNFTAVYSAATKTWTVTKSHPDNNATVTGNTSGNQISIKDCGLPYGTYSFQVVTPCDSDVTSKTFTAPTAPTPYWTYSSSYATCTTSSRSISLSAYNTSSITTQQKDSTVIKLVNSPYDNRYNFEAVYSASTNTWTIDKEHLENTANITGGSNGFYLSISDIGLPNGTYKFNISSKYGNSTITQTFNFGNMQTTVLVEDPEYIIDEECVLSYITYVAGKYQTKYYQSSTNPDQDFTLVSTGNPTTYVQIISGPLGGYDDTRHTLNEPIRISMPGRFIVRLWPNSNCYSSYYDTIYYTRNTVEFEYDYAMLCDSNSTQGNVYVKGINGRKPYVYTLYDGPDKTGNVIETNSTGVFVDVPMTSKDTLSCMVRDSCGAYFHVNIRPETWTDLQKVWFDNGLTVSTTCEGSTICVNALSIGSILKYEWTGPDGFTDTASRSCVFIPRGGEEGWYKVHIYNTGCTADYIDSIYLHIDRSPSVELADDFTVCPGAPAELKFVPSSPNPTDEFTLKIVLETESGKTTKTLTVPAGDTARYTLVPLTRTKVYVSSIFDGHCEYTIVEDTQFVDVYTINPYTVTTTHDTVCWETTANLSARASLTPPYAIRWYTDYNLTQLVQEDSIFSDGEISSRVLPNMVRDSIFYIMVENNEYCPTTYGMPIHSMNMNNGSTQLSLGNTYRFYDSGGPNANYYTNELLTHTFSSTDGKPVTLKFESFNFSSTSHLYIFTGSSTDQDSLLYDLKRGDANPGTITSRGDALTVYFVSGGSRASGWSAIVEHEPAKAIATVRPKNTITYYDTVCQSQTHTYSDPYHISPDVTSPESLNNALRTYGTYAFSNVLEGAGLYGCDSTVNFYLTVTIPPRHDTTVVITNMHHTGFLWFDSLYTQSGSHIHYTPLEGGCDLMEILYLAVLDIDTLSNDICLGDSTDLIITVKKREIEISERLIPRVPRLGDVLCTDGTTMHPDSFLISGKTAMGVVMSVDAEAGYGRAIALSNAYNSYSLRWAYSYPSYTHSNTITTYYSQAVTDMDGAGNTEKILKSAKDAGGTNTASYAPAAHYCKFYNHNTYGFGTDSLGWYLPAAGEMQLIYGNRVELNKTLTKLRSQSTKNILLSNSNYWTSTEYNNSYSWYLYNTGYLYYYGNKTSSYYARPVIKFPLP